MHMIHHPGEARSVKDLTHNTPQAVTENSQQYNFTTGQTGTARAEYVEVESNNKINALKKCELCNS